MVADVGKKIKQFRTENGFTLKDLSEMTSLSTGFLSQLERGLTTVAIDSLEKIAQALGVDLNHFFALPEGRHETVLRSHARQVFRIENNQFIHYLLSRDVRDKKMLPRFMEILPHKIEEELTLSRHGGEEFVYIIEGILTLGIDNCEYDLYPGDTAHYSSRLPHNFANNTSKTVKLIIVNTPNVLQD